MNEMRKQNEVVTYETNLIDLLSIVVMSLMYVKAPVNNAVYPPVTVIGMTVSMYHQGPKSSNILYTTVIIADIDIPGNKKSAAVTEVTDNLNL